MFRKLCHAAVIVAAIATVNTVRPAAAEPVTILGGVINYSRQNQAEFRLTLVDGGLMQGQFGDGGSESWDPPHACFACVPGSTIDPSLSESMPKSEDVTVGGVLILHDVKYFITNLSFTIDSDQLRVPPASAFVGRDPVSSVAQFVLRGLVQASTPNASSAGLSLLGHGKANIQFLSDGSWFATNFRFEDPAAVPEPATLLLFGPFAVGAVARWRRRPGSGIRDAGSGIR